MIVATESRAIKSSSTHIGRRSGLLESCIRSVLDLLALPFWGPHNTDACLDFTGHGRRGREMESEPGRISASRFISKMAVS